MSGSAASARWAFGGLAGKVGVQAVAAFLVARIVGPDIYGTIGEGLTYYMLTQLLLDQGISQALIRKKDLERADVASAQVITLVVAVAFGLLTIISAPALADFFDDDRLTPLLILLALGLPIRGASIQAQAILQRDFHFRRLASAELVSSVVGVTTSTLSALAGADALTLAVQVLVTDVIYTAAVLAKSGYPLRGATRKASRELLGFTGSVAGSQWLGYVNRNVDNVLIGRVLGQTSLAYYLVSYRLMMLPITNLTMVANRVLLPTYSRHQDDPARFRDVFLKSSKMMAICANGMIALLIVFASPLIHGTLGDSWAPAVVPTQVLCLVAIVQTQTSLITPAIIALGRARWQLWWSLVFTIVTVATFVLTVHWGVNAVCVGYAIVSFATLPAPILLVGRLVGFSLADFAASMRPGLVLGAVAAAIGYTLRRTLELVGVPALPVTVVGGLAAASITALAVWFLMPSVTNDLLELAGRSPRRPRHALHGSPSHAA